MTVSPTARHLHTHGKWIRGRSKLVAGRSRRVVRYRYDCDAQRTHWKSRHISIVFSGAPEDPQSAFSWQSTPVSAQLCSSLHGVDVQIKLEVPSQPSPFTQSASISCSVQSRAPSAAQTSSANERVAPRTQLSACGMLQIGSPL